MNSSRRKKLHLDRSTVKRLSGLVLARANGGEASCWLRSDVRYCMSDGLGRTGQLLKKSSCP